MPVRKDASGRRSVQQEVEVPGTPEEVWKAIATGPGISSWFVPTEVETGDGGTPKTMVSHFSPEPGMDSIATVTTWDPPRRFVAETPPDGPNAPPVATEWSVEAKSGDVCVVRVVHSWFASSDDWDNQFEGHEQGWVSFFRILRLSLAAFRGQPSAAFQLMGFTPAPAAAAWTTLARPLGLLDASAGQKTTSSADAPRLSATVESVGVPEFPEMLLRLEEPTPGIAHLFAMSMGGTTIVPVRLYLYGDRAATVAASEEPRWKAWINEQFQVPGDAGTIVDTSSS